MASASPLFDHLLDQPLWTTGGGASPLFDHLLDQPEPRTSPLYSLLLNLPEITTDGGTSPLFTFRFLLPSSAADYLLEQFSVRAFPAAASEKRQLASISGLDGTTTFTIGVYVCPGSSEVSITDVFVRCTAATNITVPAEASLGVNTQLEAIAASQVLTDLTTANRLYRFDSSAGKGIVLVAGDALQFTIDQGATGTGPTQTLAIDVFGYLV